ncbi:MAG: signal recognition particle-docking protein FtsY [Litoreibacter sp.]|nr:signal recognition particle-docking protein FtsY [Litoreibacter sp.]
MSFFNKLKSKLFKSSSKLDEGLDAIVADGGVEETVDSAAEEAARLAEAQRQQEAQEAAARDASEAQARAEAAAREAKRQAAEAAALEEAQRAAEAAERAAAEEAARLAAEEAAREAERRAVEEAARVEARRAAEEAERRALEDAQAQEAARIAAEAVRLEAEEKARKQREVEEEARKEREREAAARAEAARQAEEDAERQREAAAAAAAQAAKEAEAAKAAEEKALADAKASAVAAMNAPAASALLADDEAETESGQKPGLFGRLIGRKEARTVVRRELDDDMLEALEELLIASDMGVNTALRVTANMAEGRFGKKLSTQEIKELLASEIANIMEPVAKPMPLYPKRPQVVLVVGVNGSGKTTTIGKLASQFRAAGKKVVIAAGDTFRAAAVEQLQVWGERAGVPVLTAPEGSDPASLAFDAMTKAEEDGADLLMIDTAGRLQNRADLMEELAKIVRVIRKKDDTAPHNTLLVLDATTGQNALNQVEVFQNISDVSGLVMTKLDGTAKGGVLVALADKFGLPIHAIGVGEQIDDLAAFDPEEFAQALTGISAE